jgi:hypothetical protein
VDALDHRQEKDGQILDQIRALGQAFLQEQLQAVEAQFFLAFKGRVHVATDVNLHILL